MMIAQKRKSRIAEIASYIVFLRIIGIEHIGCRKKVRNDMTKKEYEEFEKTAFQLGKIASQKQSIEVAKANNYHDGYAQALSDMLHCAKDSVRESEESDER